MTQKSRQGGKGNMQMILMCVQSGLGVHSYLFTQRPLQKKRKYTGLFISLFSCIGTPLFSIFPFFPVLGLKSEYTGNIRTKKILYSGLFFAVKMAKNTNIKTLILVIGLSQFVASESDIM